MSDAPETIWVDDERSIGGSANILYDEPPYDDPYICEYRRADLPAPDPMDDPRVQALVEAGTELLDYCETGNWPSVDPVQKARAALAAMEHDT